MESEGPGKLCLNVTMTTDLCSWLALEIRDRTREAFQKKRFNL